MTNSHDVLHKIVTQKEKDRTITNAVEVIQAVAGDLKSQVTQLDKARTVTNALAVNLKSQVTQLAKDRTVTGSVTAVQPTAANFKNTEVNSEAIKIAVERIDNQEDVVTYVGVIKETTDGDIIAAPGVGFKLKIHHIFVNNAGANTTIFGIGDGTGNIFNFCLAAEGGAIAQNFKRPVELDENKPLYYDYVSGAAAVIYITIGYEVIVV